MNYQLFGRLRTEEYAALEADIVARGVMVAVEKDEDGNVLDGHHRVEIAEKHGKTYKTVIRKFSTEEEKREHIIKLNLARRHLEPWQWGRGFKMLLEGPLKAAIKKAVEDGIPPKEAASATIAVKAAEVGVLETTARMRMKAADAFAALPRKRQTAVAKGEMTLADARRETKREEVKAKLEDISLKETKAIQGVYDVLVIDPPWAMEKIERDERTQQVEKDYPTMGEDDLKAMAIPAADNCHVWLWTTHRFLPMAFRLLEAWGLKYICAFVWHKPGGFQPVGLPQYNCEFALYARKGSPTLLDTKDLPVCFKASRGKHSEKPNEFYDTVRRVTAGRRLDMYGRRAIDGFDSWGKEAPGNE